LKKIKSSVFNELSECFERRGGGTLGEVVDEWLGLPIMPPAADERKQPGSQRGEPSLKKNEWLKKRFLTKNVKCLLCHPAADERKQPRFLARKTGSLKKEGWLKKGS
jgi:hypothetical protein